MSQALKFLFAPLEADGHFYASIGIGQQLLSRGHSVFYVTPNSFKGKLTPLGFIEKYIQEPHEGVSKEEWVERISGMAPLLAMTSLEILEYLYVPYFSWLVQDTKNRDEKLGKIMVDVKPDVVIVDTFLQTPALVDQGIPWVLVASINSIAISNIGVPPAFTGYPVLNADKGLWKVYREKETKLFDPIFQDFKSWVMEKGGPELKYSNFPLLLKYSPYGNLYMQPEELTYTSFRPDPPNWFRFDSFVRAETEEFRVPSQLENLPGKLIYFSMGTWGCYELELMAKLIGFLGNSPNRFIVSKGPLEDQIDLPWNMWGAARVPQTNVIPLVDLVITHGGNNTISEAFYFGKKVLVLPLCFDQLDNGQRVQETGLGLQFKPYHVTQEELLAGIETLLKDEFLEKKLISISKRIQASNSQSKAANFIESVAQKGRLQF